jgi:hypothetical protein
MKRRGIFEPKKMKRQEAGGWRLERAGQRTVSDVYSAPYIVTVVK